MKVHTISKKNGSFQVFEAIKGSRQKRNEHKLFLIEGVNPINNYIESGAEAHAVLRSTSGKLSDWAKGVTSKFEEVYDIVPELFKLLSDKENASEIILVGKMEPKDLPEPGKDKSLYLILDRPQNPGNLGSIIRSANALGVDGVGVIGHATDLYDPQTIRASIGSSFRTPVEFFDSNNSFSEWLESMKAKQKDLKVVGTSSKGDTSLLNYDFTNHNVVLVGNEGAGLSTFMKELADDMVKIPMEGNVSSLNIACAATLVLHEIKRRG